MSTKLSPYQFFGTDASGDPLSGYQVFTYAAGSTTKQTAYQDSGGVTPHANPIELDTLGFPPAPIWLTEGETYKLVVAEPDDTDPPTGSVRIFDNISGVNDTASSIDQWIAGPTPTYVSATQFTLAGDQTGIFHVGRRLKTTNSGGTIYSTITVSAYTSLTTITVTNDSGTLDAGLSAVFYGLLSNTNRSIPAAIPSLAANNAFTGVNTFSARTNFSKGLRTTGPTIADDGVFSIALVGVGACIINQAGALTAARPDGLFKFTTSASPVCVAITTFQSNVTFTTGTLTGTTGDDGDFTISASATHLHFENRSGSSVQYQITIFGEFT